MIASSSAGFIEDRGLNALKEGFQLRIGLVR
jgi:hypothetical protein